MTTFKRWTGSAWEYVGAPIGTTVLDEVRLRRVANQSINNTTYANVSWDTEDADASGFITATSDTITVPTGKGGVYHISATAATGSSLGTGRAFMEVVVAGVAYRNPFGTGDDHAAAHANVRIAAAGVVTVGIFHSQGGAQNFTASLQMFRYAA